MVLQTLLTEVERILNETALTVNSNDPNDLEPLTPAHFLMQRKVFCLPHGVFDEADMFKKKWRPVQFLTELFWKKKGKGIYPHPSTTRQMAQGTA